MTAPVVLVVEDDASHAATVARAIEALAMPRARVVNSGDAAVLWIGANPCDVCVLDYDLPGIDGLETLARIRQRRPDLPVVMTSSAASERVAIAAFHAGVLDYVPKTRGYAETVAQRVRQALQATDGEAAASPPVAPGVPAQLAAPTYQNRLRVIGRQLDLYNYQSVNIMEVAGGFLVRAMSAGSRAPEALEFADRDFPAQVSAALAARGGGERKRAPLPLLPTGYEDFLRAVGHRLDASHAEAVTLTDLGSFIAVGGVGANDSYNQVVMAPLQWLMRPDDITFLLDESYRRRAALAERRPLLNRVLGHSEARGH